MKNSILRKFEFKKDQSGIINRYLREKGGWDSHLTNTKNFILHATKNKEKNICVVLGSGWLLDVPVDELSKIFKELYLIDIVHPRQITHKYRKYQNIKFIEADISGFIEPVYYFLKEKNNTHSSLTTIKQELTNEFKEIINKASLVISVNILNQLDILICDYVSKSDLYSDKEIYAFRKTIQQKHIEMLPKNKSCIITDYEELNYDDNMQLVKNKPLVYIDLPTGKNIQKWKWNFDLSKTYHKEYKTIFKVMAWEK